MDPRYHDEVRFLVRHEDQVQVQYTCNIRRRGLFLPFDHNLGTPYGNRYFRMRMNCMRHDRLAPNPLLPSSVSINFLDVPQNLIAQKVRSTLLSFNIPRDFCNSMTTKILNVAQGMANTTCRSLVVDIMVETLYDNHVHEHSQVVEESMEDEHQRLVPARKTSIEELERVKIGGGRGENEGPASCCSICLEDFKADDEAIRMPCEHLFHSTCILHWLQRRNICPLCRFELPPEIDDD